MVNDLYLMPWWSDRRQVDPGDRRDEVDLVPKFVSLLIGYNDLDLHIRKVS